MRDYTKIPMGCLPARVDARNYTLAKLGIVPGVSFPGEYPGGKTPETWKRYVPPNAPYDQDVTNMCVAFSGAAGKSISEYRERGAWEDYSWGQIYGWREDDHYHGEGMYLDEAAQCLQRRGVAPLTNFNQMGNYYNLSSKIAPHKDMLERVGLPQRIVTYAFPANMSEIQAALMLWGWVWVSMPVHESFYRGGHLDMPSGNFAGNHAVVLIGWYTDPVKGFRWIYLNSWGKEWGELKGFFTTPINYPVNQYIVLTDLKPVDRSVHLKIGQASYKWGDKEYPLDVAPQLLSIPNKPGWARTMVPLRAVGEITGYAVDWIEETKEIILTPPN